MFRSLFPHTLWFQFSFSHKQLQRKRKLFLDLRPPIETVFIWHRKHKSLFVNSHDLKSQEESGTIFKYHLVWRRKHVSHGKMFARLEQTFESLCFRFSDYNSESLICIKTIETYIYMTTGRFMHYVNGTLSRIIFKLALVSCRDGQVFMLYYEVWWKIKSPNLDRIKRTIVDNNSAMLTQLWFNPKERESTNFSCWLHRELFENFDNTDVRKNHKCLPACLSTDHQLQVTNFDYIST